MVDTISTNNAKSNDSKSGAKTERVDTNTRRTTESNAASNKSETESEDERLEREENEARSNGFKYAKKVNEDEDPTHLDNEADQGSASWLIANGYAEMHSVQEGFETYNYILLTEDGKRALSTYNEEAE